MAKVVIPPDLQGNFNSTIPTQGELEVVGATDWGARFVQNSALWTQFALSRFWFNGNTNISTEAQGLIDLVPGLPDAVATWEAAQLPGNKLSGISQGVYRIIETGLTAIESIPNGYVKIIATVARIGIFVQKAFWNRWYQSIQPQPAPIGLSYNADTDNDVQRQMISLIGGGDPTSMFLPRIDLSSSGGQIDFEKVQDLNSKKGREWKATPTGGSLGLGAMPAGMGIPWAWQGPGAAQWSDFAPGSLQAAILGWALTTGEFRDEMDWGRVKSEWYTFWSWVQKKANELNEEFKATSDVQTGHKRNVLLRALRPVQTESGPGVGQQLYGTGGWLGPDGRGEGPHMGDIIIKEVDKAKENPFGSFPVAIPEPGFLGPGALAIPDSDNDEETFIETYGPAIAGTAAVATAGYLGYKYLLPRLLKP